MHNALKICGCEVMFTQILHNIPDNTVQDFIWFYNTSLRFPGAVVRREICGLHRSFRLLNLTDCTSIDSICSWLKEFINKYSIKHLLFFPFLIIPLCNIVES